MHNRPTGYRPDIDGLRAVAILAVVLFHANFSWIKGGFVGVDIFFVISGYLITGIILKNNDTLPEFLKKFYEGRVRRLLPPAIPVLIFTSVSAYILLSAEAMDEYAKSLLSFSAFVSNWYFLDISGYFDGPSHLKPLLHTWSLSVEEQFYVFFPLAALLLMRIGRHALSIVVLAIIAASFLINIYLVSSGDLNSAFFNSLGRFWEMGIGAALACGVVSPVKNRAMQEAAGCIGLVAIIVSIVLLDPEIAFPGAWALIPTIGTALVIYANGGIARRVLSVKPVVGVGLISYALYLWHWPIFSFLNIHFSEPTSYHFWLSITASFLLSIASYFMIERPVRSRSFLPSRSHAFYGYALVLALFLSFGFSGVLTQGFPWRLPESSIVYASHKAEQLKSQRQAALLGKCWVNGDVLIFDVIDRCVNDDGRPRILLVGDSHSAQLYTPLTEMLTEYNISLLAVNSCSLSGTVTDMQRKGCVGLMEYLNSLQDGMFDQVIMTSRANLSGENLTNYIHLAERLSRSSTVLILGPVQFYQPNMPDIFGSSESSLSNSRIIELLDSAVQESQFKTDIRYRDALKDKESIRYVSLLEISCPLGKCDHFDDDGLPVLIDNSHLSLEAARLLVKKLIPKMAM